jgi:hypothetical protein
MEGYRKWAVAIATLLIEGFLVWKGMANLVPDVTLNVVAIINAVFNILALFMVPVAAGIYMHYNVKQANQLRKK